MYKEEELKCLESYLLNFNFKTKVLRTRKTIIAKKLGFPKLYFVFTDIGILITNMLKLNEEAEKRKLNVLKFINELNQKTKISKYYLEQNNILISEAIVKYIVDEQDFQELIAVLYYDMFQTLKDNKKTINFIN